MTGRLWGRRLGALALVLGLGACGLTHRPVVVVGEGTALVGVWEGTYESEDTGRVGDIYFALAAEGAGAEGEVVMVPRGAVIDVSRAGDTWRWEGVARPRVLTIQFVRLEGNRVVGELDPYPDPDCGCTLRTTFRGTIDGDAALGTFHSSSADPGHEADGTWVAARRSAGG